MTGLQEAHAAFERGRNVIVVAPPAVEHSDPVWELLGPNDGERRPGAIIVCADPAAAVGWSEHPRAAGRVHAVTGLGRTQRLLAANPANPSNPPPMLAGSAKDLAALVARSALKLDQVRTVVLAWLEDLASDEQQRQIDPLLAEAADARRIVLTWDPGRASELIERHAFRAPMVGRPELNTEGRPAAPVGPARFALAPRARRSAAARAAVDTLGAVRPLVWYRGVEVPDTADAVILVDLPSREEFARLSTLGGSQPLLLLSATQLAYARTLASPLTPFSLPTAADLALDRAQELRNELAAVLQRDTLDAELAILAPLFEDYDPGQVAAALLALSRQPAASHQPSAVSSHPSGASQAVSRLFISVGKKDRATAKDLVGALIREAGLSKEEIGRIELRDTFSLVDVVEAAAARALRLAGATIRGRRVTIRMDRHG